MPDPDQRALWPEKPGPLKRSDKQRALIESGRHPFHPGPIRTDGETCGSCANCEIEEHGRRYYKCALRKTAGAATDIRKSWPGCKWWRPAEKEAER